MRRQPRSLSQDEVVLVNELENGAGQADPQRPLLVVSADTIRAIVLGFSLRWPEAGDGTTAQERAIEIDVNGLTIRRCIVKDELNLEDASGPNSTALPPLRMEECVFVEKISISRAHFKALSLKGSRITEIDGSNLHVEGSVNVSEVRSSEGTKEVKAHCKPGAARTGCLLHRRTFGKAVISIPNSKIEGDFQAMRSVLAAGPKRQDYDTRSQSPKAALNLRLCTIGGHVNISAGSFLGGVAAPGAKIGGNFLAIAARVVGIERDSLTLDGAVIQGTAFLRPGQPEGSRFRRFKATGTVSMRGARVLSGLAMQGALLRNAGETALIADQAEFGNSFFSGYLQGTGMSARYYWFEANGSINVQNASFKGFVFFGGAHLLPDKHGNSLIADGLIVEGILSFSAEMKTTAKGTRTFPFIAMGTITLTHADLRKDLDMSGAQLRLGAPFRHLASLSAEGLHVKGNCGLGIFYGETGVISDGRETLWSTPVCFSSSGQLFLSSIDIGGSLLMSGARIRASADPMPAIEIDDSLLMSGARIRASADSAPALELFGAHIGKEANLSASWVAIGRLHAADGEGGRGVRSVAARFTSRGPLNLPYLKTGEALLLRGATLLEGGIRAAYADIGSMVSLGPSFNPSNSNLASFVCSGQVDFSDAKVGSDFLAGSATITSKDAKRTPLRVSDSVIDGDLRLSDTNLAFNVAEEPPPDANWVLTILDLSSTEVGGSLSVDLSVSAPPCNIDLRDLHIHQIEDGKGSGWGANTRLRLEGFVCDRLTQRPEQPRWAKRDFIKTLQKLARRLPAPLSWFIGALLRTALALLCLPLSPLILVAGFLYTLTVAAIGKFTAKQIPATLVNAALGGLRLIKLLWLIAFDVSDGDAHYLKWLKLQYRNPKFPTQEEFTPSAYDHLAKSLREEGYEQEANHVLMAKLRVKRKVSTPWFAQPFWLLYDYFFGHGLSALKAFSTMLLCLALGTFAVWVADSDFSWPWKQKHVMVVTTSTVDTLAVQDPNSGDKQLTTAVAYPSNVAGGEKPVTDEIPCGKRIDPALYAMEVFIPALDLNQTSLCEISYQPYAKWWRKGRALYAILGWIVTSITVLTIPGILRKRAEE